MTFQSSEGTVWLLPLGSEVLDVDGKQAFYATEDGAGSVVSVGTAQMVDLTFEVQDAAVELPETVTTTVVWRADPDTLAAMAPLLAHHACSGCHSCGWCGRPYCGDSCPCRAGDLAS